jgi:RNA polymerase sigma-70 factor (ECF subfamily)
MNTEEQALITRAQQGEVEAFEHLVTAYEARVYRLALKLTNEPADSMEIVQDVFLTVYTKLSSFKGEGAFASWLYRIAVNAAYMKLRARKRREEVSLDAGLPAFTAEGRLRPDVADWSQIPEETVLRGEATRQLQQAIAQLPPDYRVVFVLGDTEGLSHREIGDMLALSVPAVKSRLHRARLFLRHHLATYFGFLSNFDTAGELIPRYDP